MRILHIEVGGTFGGSAQALKSYLSHCDRAHSHDVVFYYPTPGVTPIEARTTAVRVLHSARPPAADRLGEASGDCPPGQLRAGARAVVALLRGIPTLLRLRHLFSREAYDVIHVNNTLTYQPLSMLAAASAQLAVVAHVRNPVRWTRRATLLSRTATRLVSVNQRFAVEARSAGVSCPVTTCYDGLEFAPASAHDADEVRRELAPANEVLIGSVGRLEPQKGYADLLHAAQILLREHSNLRFVLAGSGTQEEALQRLASSLGIADRVRFLGFRSDIPRILSALDIFVSSSHWEGLPLAILEAMLAKTAVVATDAGGTAEIVHDGRTGRLVPMRRPDCLARAVSALVNDPTLRRRFAHQGSLLARPFTDLPARSRALDDVFAAEGVHRRRSMPDAR